MLSPHRAGAMTDSLFEIGRQTVADAGLVLRGLPPSPAGAPSANGGALAVEADRAQLNKGLSLDIASGRRPNVMERYRTAGGERGGARSERSMAGRTPTIRDVAARAAVSYAPTASNVVNGNRPVGEASCRRVVEAIAALHYRLDRAASALRGKATRACRYRRSRDYQCLLREPCAWGRGARRTRRL